LLLKCTPCCQVSTGPCTKRRGLWVRLVRTTAGAGVSTCCLA
jgi:hypothetical protein